MEESVQSWFHCSKHNKQANVLKKLYYSDICIVTFKRLSIKGKILKHNLLNAKNTNLVWCHSCGYFHEKLIPTVSWTESCNKNCVFWECF